MSTLHLNHMNNGAPSETPAVSVGSPSYAPDAAPIILIVASGHDGSSQDVFLTTHEAQVLVEMLRNAIRANGG